MDVSTRSTVDTFLKSTSLTLLLSDHEVEEKRKYLSKLTALTELHFVPKLHSYERETLKNLPLLQILTLSKVDAWDMYEINKLENLKSLKLHGFYFSNDEPIQQILKATQLKKLDLTDGTISEETLKTLANLKLEELTLCRVKGLTQLEGLGQHTTLKTLKVMCHHLEENYQRPIQGDDLLALSRVALDKISKLPHLRNLDLWNTKINPEDFSLLSRLTTLQYLDIHNFYSCTDFSEKPFDPKMVQIFNETMLHLTNLRFLNLDRSNCTDAVMNAIGGLTRLEQLFLADCSISAAGMAHVARLINLKNLNLLHNHVKNEGVARLTALTNLRYLNVTSAGVNNQTIISLSTHLVMLERLFFSFNFDITDSILDHLISLPQLKQTSFSTAMRYDELHKKLSENPNLRWVQNSGHESMEMDDLLMLQ